MSVCYDMRFPELYRRTGGAGREWLAMPAAFTVPTGRAHWETLLRARAIENLCYVVAPAQCGHAHERPRDLRRHVDRRLLGPGARRACRRERASSRPRFDLARQAETRARFPALTNRRLGVPRRRGGAGMSAAPDPLDVAREDDPRAVGPGLETACRPCSAPLMSRGVDYADLYFQLSREESWSLEDGIVKDGSHSIEQGVGVRAISGEKTGFAYSDEIVLPALVEASRSGARHRAQRRAQRRQAPGSVRRPIGCICRSIRSRRCATRTRSPGSMRIDRETRRIDPRVEAGHGLARRRCTRSC